MKSLECKHKNENFDKHFFGGTKSGGVRPEFEQKNLSHRNFEHVNGVFKAPWMGNKSDCLKLQKILMQKNCVFYVIFQMFSNKKEESNLVLK